MNNEFLQDVRRGFSGADKYLPAKWLYDDVGSQLFEDITQTEDYYVTRTEASIMAEVYRELPEYCPPGAAIVEFGSGAGVKSRRLMEALNPATYVLIDIAEEFLEASKDALARDFPKVTVEGVVADFSGTVALPESYFNCKSRMGFFPGSTIGNFEAGGAQAFLAQSRESLGDGAQFLIGVDLVKDDDVLLAAYDDDEGVTRRFTKNILERINRELDGTIDTSDFEAMALWNPERQRIELGLLAQRDQTFTIAGESFRVIEGDMLHTENSHKYTRESFGRIADTAGWQIKQMWTDPKEWFGVFLLTA